MAILWRINDTGRTALDDVSRIATEYDANGVLIGPRPFTSAENAAADAVAMAATEATNRASIESALSDALVEIQTIIDATNQSINSSPASYIKILARAARRIIRLLIRRFDGTT